MNIVKLMGGLGNQLFQYAFGRVVEECSKCLTQYDMSWYNVPRMPPRPYLLNKFHMRVSFAFQRIGRIEQEQFHNMPSLYSDNTYFTGYWQNADLYTPKLVEEFRDSFHVRAMNFTPQFGEWRKKIRNCNAVALHVRRGDYLANPNHLVLPMEYYDNALKQMDTLKNNIEVFVFSDDIDWCKKNFQDCHFIDIPEDYLQFELMRECKHFIIANSTFSWWPAYLSEDSTVITPKRWNRYHINGAIVHEQRMLRPDWVHLSLS